MAQAFFVQGATLGVDLNNQSTTQLFALGLHCMGTNNSEWVYVQANTSIVGQTVVAFNATYTAGMASGGDLSLGNQIATAQTSISSQAFGWVCTRGVGLTVATTGTASLSSAVLMLAASGVPTGVLITSATVSGSNSLAGIALVATVSGSLGVYIMSWPRGFVPGE